MRDPASIRGFTVFAFHPRGMLNYAGEYCEYGEYCDTGDA